MPHRGGLSGWDFWPWACSPSSAKSPSRCRPRPTGIISRPSPSVFGLVPRFAIASLVAYWAGEFTNSYTMAKLKLLTRGSKLWTRTIGSTLTGQAVDTTIVIMIAFYDAPWSAKANIIMSSYLAKVVYEVLATPLTYAVVYGLKKSETCGHL